MDRLHPTEPAPSRETSPSTARAELGVLRAELSGDSAEPQIERALERWGITLLAQGETGGYPLYHPAHYPAIVATIRKALEAYPPDVIRPIGLRISLYDSPRACAERAGGVFARDKTMLVSIAPGCGDRTVNFHHELMHFIDNELYTTFLEQFPATYHADFEGYANRPRTSGFADQYCEVGVQEDIARTAEALWDGAAYRRFTALRDPIVMEKLRAIARFYRSKGIRAPYINTLLGAEQQPVSPKAFQPVSASQEAVVQRSGRSTVNTSPDRDGFLGRAVYNQDWYIYVWKTRTACETGSGGETCQSQPDGTWAYYRNKAEVDRILRGKP